MGQGSRAGGVIEVRTHCRKTEWCEKEEQDLALSTYPSGQLCHCDGRTKDAHRTALGIRTFFFPTDFQNMLTWKECLGEMELETLRK